MKVALSLLALLTFATPVAARTIDLGYVISWGGIEVFELNLTYAATSGDYKIILTARPRGIGSMAAINQIDAVTVGHERTEGLFPLQYDSLSQGHEERRTHMVYHPDGSIETVNQPPQGEEKDPLDRVPPEMIPGTVDLMTALFALGRQDELTGRCDGTARIFDGRRRYDVAFQTQGHETLAPEGVRQWAGEAEICKLHVTIIKGRVKDKKKRVEGEDPHIWIARVIAGGPPVPVEIAFSSNLGVIRTRLARMAISPDPGG